MLRIRQLVLAVLFIGITVTSCRRDDEPLPSEQELITTVLLNFTNQADPDDIVTVAWRDLDGPGGNQPQIDQLTLAANTTYDVEVQFLDESDEDDVEDITEEIEEEDDEHEIFYLVQTANLTISNRSLDRNGLPLGLEAVATTGAPGTGTLRVVLKHKPGQKSAGDSEAVGETDVDAAFPVTIQ
jgi:hypothetical protein